MTHKEDEATEAATEVENQEAHTETTETGQRKDPKWGEMTKQGLVIGRGANKKVIDPREVEKLAEYHCTIKEIADFFDVPRETLLYNFRYTIVKAQERTKQRLRKAQLDLALKGNAVMLIWLGKNILQQQDNPQDSSNLQPLPWSEEE
tara:strand:+ start:1713 stop:2156 length:444 start_codon:yes stop_codon:yes gene_type:complete